MISEVVIDKLTYGPNEWGPKPWDEKLDEAMENEEGVPVKLVFDEEGDRTPYNKPPLSEIVRDYESSRDPVHIIAANDIEGHETVEPISYYEEDGVYAYESGDQVDDPKSLFIPNPHLHFGEGSKDNDIVYVENEDVDIIYEIIRITGSYKVMVLGEEPEEIAENKEEPARIKRSRRAAPPKKDPVEECTDDPHETDGDK